MRKSLLKKVTAAVCAVALTVATTTTCFAADKWTSWLGMNSGWYEGALGEVKAQSDTGWTLSLETIGWMGVWGAQVKDENISLSAGKEYTLTFDMSATDINKWIFVKVANDADDLLFGEWIQLKAGQTTHYTKTFKVDEKATKIVFGCGGEMGDRTDEEEMYKLMSSLPSDGDANYSTTITCSNYSLGEAGAANNGGGNDDNKGGNGDNQGGTGTTTTPNGGTGGNSTTVQTGDFTPLTCAAVAVVAAAAIVVFTRKREEA